MLPALVLMLAMHDPLPASPSFESTPGGRLAQVCFASADGSIDIPFRTDDWGTGWYVRDRSGESRAVPLQASTAEPDTFGGDFGGVRFTLAYQVHDGHLALPALAIEPKVSRYDVVWNTPSEDHTGSMPLGNGAIGVNAWINPQGELEFYIGRTDSWGDNARLLKLGKVRVSMAPRPLRHGGGGAVCGRRTPGAEGDARGTPQGPGDS